MTVYFHGSRISVCEWNGKGLSVRVCVCVCASEVFFSFLCFWEAWQTLAVSVHWIKPSESISQLRLKIVLLVSCYPYFCSHRVGSGWYLCWPVNVTLTSNSDFKLFLSAPTLMCAFVLKQTWVRSISYLLHKRKRQVFRNRSIPAWHGDVCAVQPWR